jgi:hypothetical protein
MKAGFSNTLRLLQKFEKSPSVILSLSKNDGKSNSYITLRQAQGDNLRLFQEAHIIPFICFLYIILYLNPVWGLA